MQLLQFSLKNHICSFEEIIRHAKVITSLLQRIHINVCSYCVWPRDRSEPLISEQSSLAPNRSHSIVISKNIEGYGVPATIKQSLEG